VCLLGGRSRGTSGLVCVVWRASGGGSRGLAAGVEAGWAFSNWTLVGGRHGHCLTAAMSLTALNRTTRLMRFGFPAWFRRYQGGDLVPFEQNDKEDDREAPVLRVDRYCLGFAYALTNEVEISGIAISKTRDGVLGVTYVSDDEQPSLRVLSLGSKSGERFASIVYCTSGENVRVSRMYAVDECGYVSPGLFFRAVSFGWTFWNDENSISCSGQAISGTSEPIEPWSLNQTWGGGSRTSVVSPFTA
jgi:hypothetical protein